MNHPLRCRCEKLRGHVVPSTSAVRAVCYCRDCQAYARFLGTPGVTDADGGTDVVAMLPQRVHLLEGTDALACMSLREHGLLRWYARCCNTPIGNTPSNRNVPYIGVARICLDGASVDDAFGASRIAVNTKSARGHVASTPVATFVAVLRLATSAIGARLAGAAREHPFFEADSSSPIRPVRVLSPAERALAYGESASARC